MPRPGPAPAGASPANQKPTDLHNTACPAHAPPSSRGQNGLTPPRRGGKEKAPKWRGRGAGCEGRRELGVEPRGRKDGEGRIDSNPNNNKAFKGRQRPALRFSVSRRFLGQGLELEHNKLRRDDGRWLVRRGGPAAGASGCEGLCVGGCRRGWSFCVTQTRDLQVGLGGLTTHCGLELGPRGLVCWGRVGGEGSARCESRRFTEGVEVAQAWNKIWARTPRVRRRGPDRECHGQ